MHYTASAAPAEMTGSFRLIGHLLQRPRWLLGMVASLLGFALHAVALRFGPLVLVQPLVVTGLMFSLLFRAALDRRLPERGVLCWAAVTAAGLAVFLTSSSSSTGRVLVDTPRALVTLGVGLVVVVVATRVGTLRPPASSSSGVLLGVAAGIVFGLLAGTLKAATGALTVGNSLADDWPVLGVLALSLVGFLLNQRAYHRAPLVSVLPILNTLNPVVSVVFGVVAFAEQPSGEVLALIGQAVGLIATLTGVFFLPRYAGDPAVVDALPAEL